MSARPNAFREVGVVVQGQASFHSLGPATESLQVVVDEQQFYKMTGMRASAPERVALLRLLDENITSAALKCVWRDELVFEDSPTDPRFTVRVTEWVPRLVSSFYLIWFASIVGLFLGNKGLVALPTDAALLFIFLISAASSVWMTVDLYRPYHVAKRLKPIVERVNRELPVILREWKQGRSIWLPSDERR